MAIGLESQRTERIIAGNRIFVSSSATLQERGLSQKISKSEEVGTTSRARGYVLVSFV